MCELCRRLPVVVELPVAAVYVGNAMGVRFAGHDPALVTVPNSMPALGYALLQKRDGRVGFQRTQALTEHGARQAAADLAVETGHAATVARVVKLGGTATAPVYVLDAFTSFDPCPELELLDRAIVATGELLDGTGVEKAKPSRRLDPSKPADYGAIVSMLQQKLGKLTGTIPSTAVKEAIASMNVDWTKATDEQLKNMAGRMNQKLRSAADTVWKNGERTISGSLASVADKVSGSTVEQYGWNIGAKLDAEDVKAITSVTSARGAYYLREFMGGPVSDKLTDQARTIAQQGVKEGWSSYEIAKQMRSQLGAGADRLTDSYLRMSADAMMSRARAHSTLQTFGNTGVTHYESQSVLDTNTCNFCRFMHGKVVSVGHALGRYKAVEESKDPRAVQTEMPWRTERIIREGEDAGKIGMYLPQAGGGLFLCGVVEKSGNGAVDDVGKYSRAASVGDMSAKHLGPPPYHGHCRCYITPVIGDVPSVTVPTTISPNILRIIDPRLVPPEPTLPPTPVIPPTPTPRPPRKPRAAPKPKPPAPAPEPTAPKPEALPEDVLVQEIQALNKQYPIKKRIAIQDFNEAYLDKLTELSQNYYQQGLDRLWKEMNGDALMEAFKKSHPGTNEARVHVTGQLLQELHLRLVKASGGSIATKGGVMTASTTGARVPKSWKKSVDTAWDETRQVWGRRHAPQSTMNVKYDTGRGYCDQQRFYISSDTNQSTLRHEMGHGLAHMSGIADYGVKPKWGPSTQIGKLQKGRVTPDGKGVVEAAFDNVNRYLYKLKHRVAPGSKAFDFRDEIVDALSDPSYSAPTSYRMASGIKEKAIDLGLAKRYIGKNYDSFGYHGFGDEGPSMATQYLAHDKERANLGRLWFGGAGTPDAQQGKRWLSLASTILSGVFF